MATHNDGDDGDGEKPVLGSHYNIHGYSDAPVNIVFTPLPGEIGCRESWGFFIGCSHLRAVAKTSLHQAGHFDAVFAKIRIPPSTFSSIMPIYIF